MIGDQRDCLKYKNSKKIIKPQYALQRLDDLTKKLLSFFHNRGWSTSNVGCSVFNI